MSVHLCFDFGNTRQKCGVFVNNKFTEEIILDALQLNQQVVDCVNQFQPSHIILGAVIHYPDEIDAYLSKQNFFIKLNHLTPLPFKNHYEKPETLGADRLAAVAGAQQLFPLQHALVITTGTCITYNFLQKDGNFLGGSISPGLNMRLQALHHFTDQLPLMEMSNDFPLIGYNTQQSILSGALNGAVAEADGIINFYRQRYNNFNVLLTGGDTEFFERRLKNEIFANLFLTYIGLHAILLFNISARN